LSEGCLRERGLRRKTEGGKRRAKVRAGESLTFGMEGSYSGIPRAGFLPFLPAGWTVPLEDSEGFGSFQSGLAPGREKPYSNQSHFSRSKDDRTFSARGHVGNPVR